MHQKFKLRGTIGYADSYLEFPFRYFIVFRLHAILHDATAAVGAHSGKGRGYRYTTGRRSNSCLLGHVTGQLFCLHLKNFLPSIFKSVEFWISLSCFLRGVEVGDTNVNKELAVFIDGNVQRHSIRPPKKHKLTKQAVWCTRNLHELCETVDSWITVSFPTILLRVYMLNNLQKEQKNAIFLPV